MHSIKHSIVITACSVAISFSGLALSAKFEQDSRELVPLPRYIQVKLLKRMRSHLLSLQKILHLMAHEQLDEAGLFAKRYIQYDGVDAIKSKSGRLNLFLPQKMQKLNREFKDAVINFSQVAEQGNKQQAYLAIDKILNTCVSCHKQFRIR